MMSDIQNKNAYYLLNKLDITAPAIDPFYIAKKLKIKVKKNLDWNKLPYDGEIYLEDGEPVIWINPTDNIVRQNFTLAHELGHFVYDVLPNIEQFKNPIRDDFTTLKRGATYNYKEQRANKFAAELLMPESLILNEGAKLILNYQKSNKKDTMPKSLFIEIMSKKFEVSKQAMEYRLKNLKLLP